MNKTNIHEGILKKGLLLIFIMVFASTFILSCYAEAAPVPKIKYFTASKTSISSGEVIELKWEVENAKTVQLIGMEKEPEQMLPLGGSLKVELTQTTNFMLVAEGDNNYTVCENIEVTVSQKPKIISFTATSNKVEKGTLITLKWSTTNATSCTITTDDGFKLSNRPANGQISITPNSSRTYKLTASNGNSTDEESIKIIVID